MDYECLTVHELRKYGREIGVKSPTTLNREQLIEQITLIEEGIVEPSRSRAGRPAKNLSHTVVEQGSSPKVGLGKSINNDKRRLRSIVKKTDTMINDLIKIKSVLDSILGD